MAEWGKHRKIAGAGRGLHLLVLLAIVVTASPIPGAQADGSTRLPVPQKGSSEMKQTQPGAAPRGVRPPIDLAIPARMETATFAMG